MSITEYTVAMVLVACVLGLIALFGRMADDRRVFMAWLRGLFPRTPSTPSSVVAVLSGPYGGDTGLSPIEQAQEDLRRRLLDALVSTRIIPFQAGRRR